MPTEHAIQINFDALVDAIRTYNDTQGEQHSVLTHNNTYPKSHPFATSIQENVLHAGSDLDLNPRFQGMNTAINSLSEDPEIADQFGHFHGVPD